MAKVIVYNLTMSKRHISQKQRARIENMQKKLSQPEHALSDHCLHDGLVLTRFSRHAEIETSTGELILCSIRPNLQSLVAGDRVVWREEGTKQGVVLSCYPRISVLERVTNQGHVKSVAANITQIVIVVSAKPTISWLLLDSYLVLAESLDLSVCIILNKTDLPCQSVKDRLQQEYAPLGYPILYLSKIHQEGYTALQQQMTKAVSVFVGQSGVGKSSLIQYLLPHQKTIAIAPISSSSDLGCHTTSNSYYYHIPSGGALIDSPGVREFKLSHLAIPNIIKGFREIQPLVTKCKFRNCDHQTSPGCAVIHAVSTKQIARNRYENFLKLC